MMSRSHFTSLLLKYQQGAATLAEKQVVEQWYALLEVETRPLSQKEWQDFEQRLWQKLQNELFETNEAPELATPLWKRGWVRVAASLIMAIGLGYVGYQIKKPYQLTQVIAEAEANGMELVVNATSKPLPILLEDGSRVLLNPQSELRFPKHFIPKQREVYLSGEAFFEVTKSPQRPFLVHTGEIITRVLGTSFRVKAPQYQKDIEVSVKTGKVAVYQRPVNAKVNSSKASNGVILTPNHRVVFLAENQTFVTSLVDVPVLLPESKKTEQISFNFDDTPLSEVLNCLEKAYSIEIEVENSTLNECPLTANLAQKTLYSQLDIICAAIQGSYEVKGTTILISGKGCD
ncbi:MAG: FecR family protein [Runella slithyformis]|nr:MAG: FecR family protein [Runella slithyformis]TAF82175.1 MAG: FecR family protein [Runella slithyformis]TAG24725.1 MAG: FecR family protein [Cytophagales bacterium]TAG42382.1 MAG: FecR family protein [Cytophagia bacterium]